MSEPKYFRLSSDQIALYFYVYGAPRALLNMPTRVDFEEPVDEEKALEAIGVHGIAVHTGVDQQRAGRSPLDDLAAIRDRDIPYLRRKIGIVFQDFQLLMDRSVEDNLDFVLQATGWKDAAARQERIDQVLESVGMGSKAHKRPHQLSGGEQQRVAIARSLLNAPALIVADEPTGNLDNDTAEGIMQLLTRINREEGTAVLMVTHNTALCERWPGRLFLCENESCREITEARNGEDAE